MPRRIVITGSASGMGKASVELFRAAGDQVIGIDRVAGADIVADLSGPDGRGRLAAEVGALTGGAIDGLLVCAGVSHRSTESIATNYFGAVATLETLQPLLARGDKPRAAVIASMASAQNPDKALSQACLDGDEAAALALCARDAEWAYTASKEALALKIRHMAITPEWGGAGILLNAVAPGIVLTPMGYRAIADPNIVALFKHLIVLERYAEPEELAKLLAFLISPDNSYMTGQVVFCDGGVDGHNRPDRI
jgi:NAD(P)-dependent dehydrogenase (short-subunit alcohol dehydrogenase family)